MINDMSTPNRPRGLRRGLVGAAVIALTAAYAPAPADAAPKPST